MNIVDKMKFQENIDEKVYQTNDNNSYKKYLDTKKNIAKNFIKKQYKIIEAREKRIKHLQNVISDLEDEILTTKQLNKPYQEIIREVEREIKYKYEIKKLIKKHSFLDVVFDDKNDDKICANASICWVYPPESLEKNDPYHGEHFCDTYKEAFKRCFRYVQYVFRAKRNDLRIKNG